MKLSNDQATAAVASPIPLMSLYCAKLEQRFAHMGISSKAASSAVQSLVEADAVPQVGASGAAPALRVQAASLPEENRGEMRRLATFGVSALAWRRAVSHSPHVLFVGPVVRLRCCFGVAEVADSQHRPAASLIFPGTETARSTPRLSGARCGVNTSWSSSPKICSISGVWR